MNTDSTKITRDVYQRVTNEIVALLEKGKRPWIQPWTGSSDQPLRANGKAYRGINTLLLWASATAKGYTHRHWMTYRQAQELGGNVRKGEHGTLVVYANYIAKPGSGDERKTVYFMRGYTVFNVEQCDGLPERFTAIHETPKPTQLGQTNERAEALLAQYADKIGFGGDRAAYVPDLDRVQLPPREAFTSADGFYNTALHELVHLTGHPSRLDRQLKNRFGSRAYAIEELIAEMGAAFLAARFGLEPQVRDDHAQYLASWLQALRDDKRAIFNAAAHAARAAEFLAPDDEPMDVEESASADPEVIDSITSES